MSKTNCERDFTCQIVVVVGECGIFVFLLGQFVCFTDAIIRFSFLQHLKQRKVKGKKDDGY